MPDLRHLRAFVAVAEELNFTRAAERLHLGQQAVSKSVGQLERELGVQLLERTTREVSLTAAGAALLAAGRPVLVAAEDAFERAKTVGRGLAGTVRIGVSPAVGAGVRQEAADVLRDGAEQLSVSFHELRPADIAPALSARTVDLVLARTYAGGPEVESTALRPTPAMLLVPQEHRLARQPSAALADLDGERLLVFSRPGTPYTDLVLARVAAAGAAVEVVESPVTGGGVPDLAASRAVTIVARGSDRGTHVAVPLSDDLPLPLLLLWPAGLPTAAVRKLRERLAGRA